MAYGAMIDYKGQTFITPESTPFVLYSRVEAVATRTSGENVSATAQVYCPAAYSAIGFIKCSWGAALGCSRNGDYITFSGSAQGKNVPIFTITCYTFAKFPQPLPRWGMAIWDGGGTCILTNESKPLSDLVTIGTPGQTTGGIYIDQTLGGSYAVMPRMMGATLVLVQIPGQQPVIVNVAAYTAANFNGSTTRINSASNQAAGGTPSGYLNTGVAVVAINTAAYD